MYIFRAGESLGVCTASAFTTSVVPSNFLLFVIGWSDILSNLKSNMISTKPSFAQVRVPCCSSGSVFWKHCNKFIQIAHLAPVCDLMKRLTAHIAHDTRIFPFSWPCKYRYSSLSGLLFVDTLSVRASIAYYPSLCPSTASESQPWRSRTFDPFPTMSLI